MPHVVWEIAIKRSLDKLDAPADLVEVLTGRCGTGAISSSRRRPSSAMPPHIALVDRLLVAQASVADAAIVSADPDAERLRRPRRL